MANSKKKDTSILQLTNAQREKRAAQKGELSAQLEPNTRHDQNKPIGKVRRYSLRASTRQNECISRLSGSTDISTTRKPRETTSKATTSKVKQARVLKRETEPQSKKPGTQKKVAAAKPRLKVWASDEVEVFRILVTDGYIIWKSALEENIMSNTTFYERISTRMEDNGYTRSGEACRNRWKKLNSTP